MNCSLVEQCSFFRVFFRGQCLIYYNTCHRGLYTVVSGSGQQNADRRQQGLRAHDVLFLWLRQKQALGKLFMHRGQQSREGDWRCHTARSRDTLKKKRPTRIHPKTLLNSHFICTKAPAPRCLGLVVVPVLPHELVTPRCTHWMRCGGSDHISQLLRSHMDSSRNTLCGPPWGSAPRVMGETRPRGPCSWLHFSTWEKSGKILERGLVFNMSYVTLSFSSVGCFSIRGTLCSTLGKSLPTHSWSH